MSYLLGAFWDNSGTIMEGASELQGTVVEAMNKLWDDIYGSELYTSLATVGGLFASITLAFSVVQVTKELIADDRSFIPYERFIWWAMVILLLVNGGENLKNLTLSYRDLIRGTSQLILEQEVDGKTLEAHWQQASGSVGTSVALQSGVASCSTITDPLEKEECINSIETKIADLIPDITLPSIEDIGSNIATAFERFFIGIMLAIGVAFQWLLEVVLILTGLLGPIAVGLSILPVTQKAIYTWLIAFYSVGLIQISYNILIAMLAVLQNANDSVNKLIFVVSIGLLAPPLAIVVGAGGGTAILSSLSSLGGAVASKGAGLAGAGANKTIVTGRNAIGNGINKLRGRKKGA